MAMLSATEYQPRPIVRTARWVSLLFGLAGAIVGALPAAAEADHFHGVQGNLTTFGSIDFENSCATSVQSEFRLAVAMLHSFAANADRFVRVANHDPACAIAWWGAAMAARGNPLVGDLDRDTLRIGQEFLAHAQRLTATPRERAFLDAIGIYYRDYPDGGQLARARAYEAAMERVFRAYPDDPEAGEFYGLAMVEAVDLNSRNYNQQLGAGKVLEALVARYPDHPGGLHYLIHAYDFAPLAARGLPAARRYASVAPASYHARHMPSHIFTMLGLWQESIRANRESNAVIDPDHASDPVGGDIAGLHAFDFITYARLQLAQDRRVAADLDGAHKAGKPVTLMQVRFALERADWSTAATMPLANDGGFDDVTARFARALGAARRGDVPVAKAELRELQALRSGIEQALGTYWAGFLDIYAHTAAAWVEKAAGRVEEGLAEMSKAAELDDAREKNIAMENKLLQAREMLGEYLLETGKPAEAEAAFAKSLEHAPNRYRGLIGAARAAHAAGHAGTARDYYRSFLALTQDADARSSDISEARDYLAKP